MTPARQGPVSSRHETPVTPGSSRYETPAERTCAAPGCTNRLPPPGPGRRADCCSDTCRQRLWRARRRQRGSVVAEVDMGSTSSKGRPANQIWKVQLRRGNNVLIVAIGLPKSAADTLAERINAFL